MIYYIHLKRLYYFIVSYHILKPGFYIYLLFNGFTSCLEIMSQPEVRILKSYNEKFIIYRYHTMISRHCMGSRFLIFHITLNGLISLYHLILKSGFHFYLLLIGSRLCRKIMELRFSAHESY